MSNVRFKLTTNKVLFSVAGNEIGINVTGTNKIAIVVANTGPQGATGPTGPAGPAGSPAVGLEYANQASISVAAISGFTFIFINNTDLSSMIDLPAVPANTQIVIVMDGNYGADNYPITISGNGNEINNPNGVSESYIIGQGAGAARFIWNGTAWSMF